MSEIELADVRWAEGSILLVFEDRGARRTCRLPPLATAALIRLIAGQMDAAGVLITTEAKQLMLRPPRPPATGVVLGLELKDWPPIGVTMDWSQLRGLSQAAWAALGTPPPRR